MVRTDRFQSYLVITASCEVLAAFAEFKGSKARLCRTTWFGYEICQASYRHAYQAVFALWVFRGHAWFTGAIVSAELLLPGEV